VLQHLILTLSHRACTLVSAAAGGEEDEEEAERYAQTLLAKVAPAPQKSLDRGHFYGEHAPRWVRAQSCTFPTTALFTTNGAGVSGQAWFRVALLLAASCACCY